jgi:hypothetical protein
MSATDLMRAASAAAQALSHDASGRTFRRLLQEFVDAMARVPDYPAADFTSVEVEQLSATAEHVIAAIERRLDGNDDEGASTRQELTECIDDIRRNLVAISRWRRHYLQS